MSWENVSLGELLFESRIPCENSDPNRRIRVKLHVRGVEKRPLENEMKGATKQFIRKSGQFIYGKQNFHKGAFGVIPEELDGFETSADIPSFDVREDCLPEWIFFYFKSGKRYLDLQKFARGVGSQRIHPKQIFEIKIPLPSKSEQVRLIQKLNNTELNFNDLGREHSSQLGVLKKLREQILQDAIRGNLVPKDANDEPAIKLLERIKAEKEKLIYENKIRKNKPLPVINPEDMPHEIHGSWVWCKLGDLFEIVRGSSPRPKGDPRYFSKHRTIFHWITIADFAKHGESNLLMDTSQFLTEEGSKHSRNVTQNDLLVAASGVGSVGKSTQVGINGYIYDGIMAIKNIPNQTLISYLGYYLKVKELEIYSIASGANWLNINTGLLRNYLLPLPSLAEQHRIVNKIEQLMTLCNELEQSIQQNQKYTQELLQVVLKEAVEPKTN